MKHAAMLCLKMAEMLVHVDNFLKTFRFVLTCPALLLLDEEFDTTSAVLDGKAILALLVVSRRNDIMK